MASCKQVVGKILTRDPDEGQARGGSACDENERLVQALHYASIQAHAGDDMIDGSSRQATALRELARRAMLQHDLEPDFPPAALRELATIDGPARPGAGVRDLRDLPWISIDNDDTRDLDQLTVVQREGGAQRVLVAIADVDSLVHRDTALDGHAQHNTVTVYTPAGPFPMLPEKLSTDLTSLREGEDRLAVVVELAAEQECDVHEGEVYRAWVHNHAKLTYRGVGAFLERRGEPNPAISRLPAVAEQLRLQDETAHRLRLRRHECGALWLETPESQVVVRDGAIVGLEPIPKSRSRLLIEDFMIAANAVTANFLRQRGFPCLQRVVRAPERWDRLERLAADLGDSLPPDPDARALALFLDRRRAADPAAFPDLSLTVVKLLGSGEYVVERPGEAGEGHFGLAVRDYTHSTAPNRRFPDLVTQRLVKAALAGTGPPYTVERLEPLAHHCTEKEDDARKVERQVRKSAAALLLAGQIGARFDGIVTGAGPKGTWVRVENPPVEGKLVSGAQGVDVGDRIRVQLVRTDVESGHIDFQRVAR
jgi:exoribonuclease-2